MQLSFLKVPGLATVLGVLLVSACSAGTPAVDAADATATDKLSPEVVAAAQALTARHAPAAPARSDSSGRLQVYIYVSQPTADTVTALTANGVGDAILSSGLHLVQGWVSPHDLGKITALPFVTRITLPRYARPQ